MDKPLTEKDIRDRFNHEELDELIEDVQSAKRLLKFTNDRLFLEINNILHEQLGDVKARDIAVILKRLRDNPDACLRIDNGGNKE